MTAEDKVILGKVGAPYGIRGWFKVHSFTDDAEGIFDYLPWLFNMNGKWQSVDVENWQRHGKGFIAKLKGIDDRTGAERLTGFEIGVTADRLEDLEDEFYWRDLIGCSVINEQNYNLGTVDALMETGSNDVLQVKANAKDAFGKSERLIPFIESTYILDVNLEDKVITVNWDPGF